MTIQASGFGRVRLAPLQVSLDDDGSSSISVQEPGPADNEVGNPIQQSATAELDALTKELEFLEGGGYRMMLGWRSPLIFEDSPICPKAPHTACSDDKCVLLEFVPPGQRDQKVPCRYIPLNAIGETLNTLYTAATLEEIENTLRMWLITEIAKRKRSDVPS